MTVSLSVSITTSRIRAFASVTNNETQQVTIVNGPIRGELDINCGDGAFGPGWRANSTIGRALRLMQQSGPTAADLSVRAVLAAEPVAGEAAGAGRIEVSVRVRDSASAGGGEPVRVRAVVSDGRASDGAEIVAVLLGCEAEGDEGTDRLRRSLPKGHGSGFHGRGPAAA